MKLPLKIGIPLLGLLLLACVYVSGQGKTPLLLLTMGVALWTAFSLPQPQADEPEEPAGPTGPALDPSKEENP